jgi:hypothetical protein
LLITWGITINRASVTFGNGIRLFAKTLGADKFNLGQNQAPISKGNG